MLLEMLLGDPTQERTITVKTKPQKKDGVPEMPLDPMSANLPQSVIDMLMQSQAMAMHPPQPMGPQQMPMSMGPQTQGVLPNFYGA